AVDIDVVANDTDPDGDTPLHIASIDTATDATKGSVSIAAGKAHYDPNGQFETLAQGATATDTFRYTVADPSNANSVVAGKVVVTIPGVDDPPVAVNDSKSVTEDDPATALDVLGNDTDVDGGP